VISFFGSPGWSPGKLQDLVLLQRGFDITKVEQKDGDIAVISSSGPGSRHNVPKVCGPGVIIGRKGTLGSVFYSETDYWPHDTTLWSKDLKGNNAKFVYYALQRIDMSLFDTGAANPTLNRNHIHGLPIFIPERKTQDCIANILAAYDDLIENNRQRIALLEEGARQHYKEWFVRFRFPGHEHVKIIDGMPEGWERLPLGDVLTLQRGFDLPVSDRNEGAAPVYGSTGIVGFHDVAKVDAPMLITGRSGSLGQVRFVSIPCWPLNTALWVREFKRASAWFAYFLLSEMGLEKFNGGASVPTLDRKVAHAAPVLLPSVRLLETFDETAQHIFELIDNLARQNKQIARARDLLLPKLMSGAIAV